MALTLPKLTWPIATEANSLLFKYPPRRQSANIQKAVRHDNTSSFGVRESIFERAETFFNIEMDNVTIGTDVSNWQTFFNFARDGSQFYYYPDSTNSAPPAAPALSAVAGGTLAAATYYAKVTYVGPNGETLASAESTLAVAANNLLKITSPAASGNATGYNVYVSKDPGGSGNETKQNTSAISIGTDWTEPATGLISGATPPGSTTTRYQATLEGADFDAAWKALGMYDFKLVFRQVIS